MARKNAAYSQADLTRWKADMTMRQPGRPGPLPLIEGTTVVSFGCGDMDTGILIVLRGDNNATTTIMLNPVVAHALRAGILQMGVTGNWLDQTGEIIPPTLQRG